MRSVVGAEPHRAELQGGELAHGVTETRLAEEDRPGRLAPDAPRREEEERRRHEEPETRPGEVDSTLDDGRGA
jgi:hypothetical protein